MDRLSGKTFKVVAGDGLELALKDASGSDSFEFPEINLNPTENQSNIVRSAAAYQITGGGGNGFIAPTATNTKSETGSGRNPPQTSNPFYIFGAGIGGSPSSGFYGNSAGGPGYIVISY